MSLKKYALNSYLLTQPKMKHHGLEAFLAYNRLIPLDESPGSRPIGVGEVLQRTAGKVIMKVVKKDIK